MPLVRIDARLIHDQNSFHDVFAAALGFPDFYGRNMDAWIDCMTYLDEPQAGMTSLHGTASDPVVVHLDGINAVPKEIYDDLVECAALVNWRLVAMGEPAILILAFDRSA